MGDNIETDWSFGVNTILKGIKNYVESSDGRMKRAFEFSIVQFQSQVYFTIWFFLFCFVKFFFENAFVLHSFVNSPAPGGLQIIKALKKSRF